MKIIYVNCGVQELFEGRSSQLYTQLMQLRKESLKKTFQDFQASTGFKPLTPARPVQRSTNQAIGETPHVLICKLQMEIQ